VRKLSIRVGVISVKKLVKNIGVYSFLSIAAFVSLFPFYWIVISATNRSIDVTRGRMLPGTYLVENFRNLMASTDFWGAFLNSLQISVLTTTFALAIASAAGYGFEIYRTRAKDMLFNILLVSMMIPFAALMIPLFRMFARITGLFPAFGIDTIPSVILPSFATAFLIFFFRQSTKMFEKEIIEAARIDGLSEFWIFIRIYMPTMKTTYVAATIITFMASWNAFLWPLVILQSEANRTLPLLISILGSSYSPDFGVILLAIAMATAPMAVLFFALQRHFVAGMMGSIK